MFKYAIEAGHIRDYDSMCYHFDFKPYKEGQISPVAIKMEEEVIKDDFDKKDEVVEETKRVVPTIECGLEDALLAYANLTMCKLILD